MEGGEGGREGGRDTGRLHTDREREIETDSTDTSRERDTDRKTRRQIIDNRQIHTQKYETQRLDIYTYKRESRLED